MQEVSPARAEHRERNCCVATQLHDRDFPTRNRYCTPYERATYLLRALHEVRLRGAGARHGHQRLGDARDLGPVVRRDARRPHVLVEAAEQRRRGGGTEVEGEVVSWGEVRQTAQRAGRLKRQRQTASTPALIAILCRCGSIAHWGSPAASDSPLRVEGVDGELVLVGGGGISVVQRLGRRLVAVVVVARVLRPLAQAHLQGQGRSRWSGSRCRQQACDSRSEQPR